MSAAPSLELLSVTWRKDKIPFAMLRESLGLSALSAVPHSVVVHSEDLPLFDEFTGIELLSSATILPGDCDHKRQHAAAMQARLGRRLTNISGSLARRYGWPEWVRYTGWHTQQLTKLAYIAQSAADIVVVMDSDVIVTAHAHPTDFIGTQPVCYAAWREPQRLHSKVRHWQETAHALFNASFTASRFDGYYDTPFVIHSAHVRALIRWLENQHQKPWWQVLLGLPPRRWSEFGIYKQFLRQTMAQSIEWRTPSIMGYLYDTSDTTRLTEAFTALIQTDHKHYITIHSQASGRGRWHPNAYQSAILKSLRRLAASAAQPDSSRAEHCNNTAP